MKGTFRLNHCDDLGDLDGNAQQMTKAKIKAIGFQRALTKLLSLRSMDMEVLKFVETYRCSRKTTPPQKPDAMELEQIKVEQTRHWMESEP